MTKLNPSAKSSSLDEKYKELCGYTLVHSTIGGKRFILFHSEPKNNILWLGSIMFIGFCFVLFFSSVPSAVVCSEYFFTCTPFVVLIVAFTAVFCGPD